MLDHQHGRGVLMRCTRASSKGLSLIELMVGLAIVAIALATGVPSFGEWLRNARVRSAAESIQSGLQFARIEATRRNAIVRFQFTDSITSSCALSTTGTYWVVNMSVSTSPAGKCANTLSDTTSPYLLKISPIVSTTSTVAVTAGRSLIGFDGLGRLNSLNDTVAITAMTVKVTASDGTCVASGGNVRCLNVVVSPSGQITLCDPAQSSSSHPMYCPT
jgi:type IV fimbrial biogenesis protein FimT